MNKFISIQQAAISLSVSTQTLRRWGKAKKIKPPHQTRGRQRPHDITKSHPRRTSEDKFQQLPTLAYARLSTHNKKNDLQRQIHMLKMYSYKINSSSKT
jgi:predicted site-specific integrase-resolvase